MYQTASQLLLVHEQLHLLMFWNHAQAKDEGEAFFKKKEKRKKVE